MKFTGQNYELVLRPSDSEYEPAEVGHESKAASSSVRPVPRQLRRIEFFPLSAQIVMTVFAALFIAFAAALAAIAVCLDGKPTSPFGRFIQRTISVSPTIFPIVFAGIIGKFFRALGLFAAERGVKLGILERLIGSQSLFSTFERQFAIRGQYLIGFAMVALWALSPLGGQSALRLLDVSPRLVSANSTVRYLPISASLMTVASGGNGASKAWTSYAPIYMTALTTSFQTADSTEDLFGNVKIPSIDAITSGANITNGSWVTIDDSRDIPYSSLLGIPVVGIPNAGNLSFNIVSRYLTVDCDYSAQVDDSDMLRNFSGAGGGSLDWGKGTTFRIEPSSSPPSESEVNNTTATYTIVSINNSNIKNVSVVSCAIMPRDAESSVFCADQECWVTAMRALTVDLDRWWRVYYPTLSIGLRFLPYASLGAIHQATRLSSSLTERWLADPKSNFNNDAPWGKLVSLAKIPLPTLSRNLEVMCNTYWQSTYGARYLFGNLSTDMSLYNNISGLFTSEIIDFNTSQVIVNSFDGEIYTCNKTFAAILLAISSILLLAGISTVSLMSMTLAPDILGYVSSYTRDNPFAADHQPSHFGGLERARAMRDVHVILGDVNMEDGIGHVAFGTTATMHRLRKPREYD
ncbi:hypothetical protein MGU_09821 [Metarhizium guizhouense ARSEF 977]|uniref:Uncharacterized protein n=1 Tax=Metarhizium guizhouense (strain ARSEF 977) TaxID=1276136 RepID=A0A0B4GT68_METGA|nr:hypothetical protein MGU_09821 [Metarhizium guizhouense ARSEF 977]